MFVYQSITIRNYRRFEELVMTDIGGINIIAGENNVGKTALLEAVYLRGNHGSVRVLDDILDRRGSTRRDRRSMGAEAWLSLFHRFDASRAIAIDAMPSERDMEAGLENPLAYGSLVLRQVDRMEELSDVLGSEEADSWYRSYGDVRPGELLPVLVVDLTDSVGNSRARVALTPRSASYSVMALSSAMGPPFLLSSDCRHDASFDAWVRELVTNKRLPLLVETLRIIEPRLEAIHVAPMPESSSALYGDVGLPHLVSLGDMGDGMNRLATFLLAVASSRGSAVLIDEIENGLHHSVHVKVWRALAEACRVFDVQLFATTHSLECIRAAWEALREAPEPTLRVHRLHEIRGRIVDVVYGPEEIGAALEAGLEVR